MSVIKVAPLVLLLTFAQRPAYDVASIKRHTAPDNITEFQMRPGGRLMVSGMSVRDFIRRAYGTEGIQTSGQSSQHREHLGRPFFGNCIDVGIGGLHSETCTGRA